MICATTKRCLGRNSKWTRAPIRSQCHQGRLKRGWLLDSAVANEGRLSNSSNLCDFSASISEGINAGSIFTAENAIRKRTAFPPSQTIISLAALWISAFSFITTLGSLGCGSSRQMECIHRCRFSPERRRWRRADSRISGTRKSFPSS